MSKQIESVPRLRRIAAVALLGVMFSLLLVVSNGVNIAHADGTPPPPSATETPKPPPTPTGGGTVLVKSVENIFHHLVFPAETISEALGVIFTKAATANQKSSLAEIDTWTSVLGTVVQAPGNGSYADVAKSSLPVAGSLAVALFVLRLAMYQWNKLLGEQDSPLSVLGDWLTAGALAVASGPFLDMVVRLGWWSMGRVLGETGSLATRFVGVMTSPGALAPTLDPTGTTATFVTGLMAIALMLGAILALAGLIFAFGVAQATLFALAVLGPSFAVASVIPEMRWLRSLWIKGVVVVAILPIMAGGVFKAGILASTYLTSGGILGGVIRILWMFGATGLLLTMTGILGRVTLGAAGEALGKMWDVGKGIVGTVALIGAGVATGGLAAVGGGAAVSGGEAVAAGGMGEGAVMAGSGGLAASGGGMGGGGALGSLAKASSMNNMSTLLSAAGLPRHAQVAGGLARGHEIAARADQLSARIGNFGESHQQPTAPDVGVDGIAPKAAQTMLENFGGSPDEFKQIFPAIESKLRDSGFDPGVVANQYPRELGSMARLYNDNTDYYNSSPDMLLSLAQDTMSPGIQNALMGRPI